MTDDKIKNPYFSPTPPTSGQPTFGKGSEYDIPEVAPFIRTPQSGDKVYFVEQGNVHWVKNPETFFALGGNFDKIETIDMPTFRKLKANVEPLDMTNFHLYVKKEEKPVPIESEPEIVKEEIEETEVKVEPPVEVQPLKTFELDVPLGAREETVATAPKAEPVKGFTSIIIPAYLSNYSVFHFTGNCIGSIREHTEKAYTPYEIILVINGKTDITFDNLEQTMADKVITNDENKGYAYAVNQGIRMALGEYIAIVNNDVMVFDNWLTDMQEALEHLDLVMATPMYGRPFARAREAGELREKTVEKPIEETFSDFRDFSCVLTRKQVFTELGTFDEDFFMYGEDLDLLRRMEQAGKKYATTRRVNIYHVIGATSSGVNETPELMEDSKKKLREKWGY